MTVIAFPHVESAGWTPEQVTLQRACATVMMGSVRESIPGAEFLQLTEPREALLCADHIGLAPSSEAYIPWLCSMFAGVPPGSLILDTDVVVLSDLSALLRVEADLVVTQRGAKVVEGRLMPFLFGVMACRNPAIWLEVKERSEKMTGEDLSWWGAQIAIRDMVFEQENGRKTWSIRTVPCSTWNYVPNEPNEPGLGAKRAVHYKGKKRKQWMLNEWSRYGMAAEENLVHA